LMALHTGGFDGLIRAAVDAACARSKALASGGAD
jgi:hypothetical protein